MSKLTTNAVTLGQSGTAANNFLIDTDSAGSLRVRRNADGSGGALLTINGSGTLVQPAQSMIRLSTGNGWGSTSTAIRRYLTQSVNQGTDITYVDSGTLGAVFTINTNGVYAISTSDNFNAANWIGISLNSASLTTSVNSLLAAEVLSAVTSPAASQSGACAWTGYLAAGSVIRPHQAPGTAVGSYPQTTQFTIVRIA